jgi:ribosomal protection tetracycline resistance protein
MALLGRLGAVVHDTASAGEYLEVSGALPSSRVPQVVAALPDLTGGEAVLPTHFDHYAPITAEDPPVLHRRGPDPGNRDE